MLGKLRRNVIIVILNVFLVNMLSGCTGNVGETETLRSLDYTLVDAKNIPQKLAERMETNLETGFELTYEENEYLYIAKGYGKQEQKDYSVVVEKLYSDGTDIYFITNLLGENEENKETDTGVYPYVVVKVERMDENVIFQ